MSEQLVTQIAGDGVPSAAGGGLHFEPRGILLTGGWTCSNRGDWALGEAALENLRRVDYPGRVLLQSFHPEVDWPIAEEHNKIAMWKRGRPKRHKLLSLGLRPLYYRAQRADMVKHLREARAAFAGAPGKPILWLTGGGIMNDVASHGRFSARLGVVASDEGWDVVMTGQTVGPFRKDESKRQFEDFARRCAFLSVRDPDSFDYVRTIERLRVEPQRVLDDVFNMEPPEGDRAELERLLGQQLPAHRFVAVTVHLHRGTDAGADWDAVFRCCDRLTERGLGVVLVTFAGHPEPADPGQSRFAETRDKVIFVDHKVSVPALRLLCKHAEFTVSTRFHGLVFSFHAGTPAVCIYAGSYYRSKSFRLMEQWGVPDLAVDIAEGWGALQPAVDRVAGDPEAYRRTLARHRPDEVGCVNRVIPEFLATSP